MKRTALHRLRWLPLAVALPLLAAEEPDIVPPANRPDPAALRERGRDAIDPAQRQRMMREFRERNAPLGINRSAWEQRREEIRKLPPAERAERMKELRREMQQGDGNFRLLSPEERDAKRNEIRLRIENQVGELKKRRVEGTLSDPEKRRLERMEQMARRLARNPGSNAVPAGALPPPRPSAPNSPTKP